MILSERIETGKRSRGVSSCGSGEDGWLFEEREFKAEFRDGLYHHNH